MKNTQQNRNNLAFLIVGLTLGFLFTLLVFIP